MTYVGIDLHSNNMVNVAINGNGEVVREATSRRSLEDFFGTFDGPVKAAVSAYTHYKVVKKFYRKIKRRSGRPVARAVVGKELAKGVWYMLTRNEEYNGCKGQPVRAASQTCWPQPINPNA
ncbi:hypothetical protein [Fodinibius saliphilus]|uniref:hypothetical protein n=1 Tax=Fodinibius saliphilus TaxID=1920650 RepID=UPI0011088652|nr:hypothetical protein [Fodinibius saliphilus]